MDRCKQKVWDASFLVAWIFESVQCKKKLFSREKNPVAVARGQTRIGGLQGGQKETSNH